MIKQTLSTNLKISQNLVMTPQLQQSIKILQLSRLELIKTIREEIEINPVIEDERYSNEESVDDIMDMDNEGVTLNNAGMDKKAIDEMDWSNYFENIAYASYNKVAANYSEESPDFEKFISKKQSIEEYLLWQFQMTEHSEKEFAIAENIIYNIDNDGFFVADVQNIAQELLCSVEDVERIRKRINFLDPIGIAAKSVEESILLQMEFANCKDSIAADIIRNNIKLLENKNIKALAKYYNISEGEVLDSIKVIHSFEPKPARNYKTDIVQTIVPDVYVYRSGDDYTIVLNDDGIPKFRLNDEYIAMLQRERKDDVRKFLQDKVNSAKWLLRSIDMREKTIYKVVETLIKFQRGFFDNGLPFLRPLVLKDVAEILDIHESTVSRTTNNKYISTPHGIFELKYFFSTGINSINGNNDFSTKVVMEKIKAILQKEQNGKPYSDDKISEILDKEHNVKLARRTVAKYRMQLNILPSSKRKKL